MFTYLTSILWLFTYKSRCGSAFKKANLNIDIFLFQEELLFFNVFTASDCHVTYSCFSFIMNKKQQTSISDLMGKRLGFECGRSWMQDPVVSNTIP